MCVSMRGGKGVEWEGKWRDTERGREERRSMSVSVQVCASAHAHTHALTRAHVRAHTNPHSMYTYSEVEKLNKKEREKRKKKVLPQSTRLINDREWLSAKTASFHMTTDSTSNRIGLSKHNGFVSNLLLLFHFFFIL